MEREQDLFMVEDEMIVESEKIRVESVKLYDGFGFGEGTISHRERIDSVSPEVLARVEEAINSDEILVPVSVDKQGNRIADDGCGDGRGVHRIYEGGDERRKSLARAKVFGGGAAMALSISIGLGKAEEKSVDGLFAKTINRLRAKNIEFGAHTDTHADENNSGCGAIDKAPAIVRNVVKYQESISKTISDLGIETTGLDDIIENFTSYASQLDDQEYKGSKVVKSIMETGKVVKELADSHQEMYVLLNGVEGYTVNQELIRSISDGKVQVFAVDLWRLQELATSKYQNDETKQNSAFLSELVYTLGVSATLTKGDLPVILLQQKSLVPVS